MTAVKPEGTAAETSGRPPWPLVTIVAIAAAVWGYVLGATGSPSASPGEDDAPATSPTTVVPVTTAVAAPADGSMPLRDVIPGLQGSLIVQWGSWPQPQLAVWRPTLVEPHRYRLPQGAGVAAPDAVGLLFAALAPGASGEGRSVLHIGTAGSLRPAALDVHSFAWHTTQRGRLAWLRGDVGSGELELWVGDVNPAGRFTPGNMITRVGTPLDEWWHTDLYSWDDHGFVLRRFDRTLDELIVSFVGPDGTERWWVPGHQADAVGGRVLVTRFDDDAGQYRYTIVDPAGDEPVSPVTIPSPEPPVFNSAFSPRGDRVAFLVVSDGWESSWLEVWDLEGTRLDTYPLDVHAAWDVEWSPDGRFVVTWGETVVSLHDTVEGRSHTLAFNAFVQGVHIRAPEGRVPVQRSAPYRDVPPSAQ